MTAVAPEKSAEKAPANPPANATPSKRGRKPGVAAKERKPIPKEFLKFTELNERETAEARRKREPRSAQQQEIDEIVLELWNKYVEKGEPKNWADKPVYSWGPMPVDYEEDALFYIRKACQLYGRRQVLGDRTYEEISGVKCVTIPFSVERRTDRKRPTVTV